MHRALILAVAALLAVLPSAAEDRPELLESSGVVSEFHGAGKHIWFSFYRSDQRFVVDGAPDPDVVLGTLRDSQHVGRSVTVRFDPAGDFRDGSDIPNYSVHALVYGGRVTELPAAAAASAGLSPGEAALVRGIALFNHGDAAGARAPLAAAVADTSLRPALRALALKTEGGALSDDAFLRLPPGEERDRELVAALADFRSWKTLAPDDAEPDLDIGSTLISLGDYDNAVAQLRALVARKPGEAFWPLLRISAVYRTRKDYRQALAALDELVSLLGPQSGMAYYYHRGWTLAEMGRYDEAIAALTAGIADQPDYAWAFVRRACAYAAVGRIHEAALDQDRAVMLTDQDAALMPNSESVRSDLVRLKAVRDKLDAADARGSTRKLDELCDGYSDYGDSYRKRSPLLPTP